MFIMVAGTTYGAGLAANKVCNTIISLPFRKQSGMLCNDAS
jgi:hypothetical protein